MSLFFRSTYMTSETWYEMISLWRTTFVQWTEGKKFVLSLGSISMGDEANFQKNYIESERKKKVQKNMRKKKKVQHFVKSSGYSVLENIDGRELTGGSRIGSRIGSRTGSRTNSRTLLAGKSREVAGLVPGHHSRIDNVGIIEKNQPPC